ncbi:hypothetical protein EVAR_65327_1 [Eumeta japonica]|uniref:Uncharacterized protein n=1 Tax=Eumeta variegata TaxID=151549 RepID=A0A4C1YWP7_EUMVA|nr:hypothetical protein EVAR_65327_1 [Eumeta japonica]
MKSCIYAVIYERKRFDRYLRERGACYIRSVRDLVTKIDDVVRPLRRLLIHSKNGFHGVVTDPRRRLKKTCKGARIDELDSDAARRVGRDSRPLGVHRFIFGPRRDEPVKYDGPGPPPRRAPPPARPRRRTSLGSSGRAARSRRVRYE